MALTIPPQPTLPPEEAPSDAEYNFLIESPPRFFPQNQDSNWGLKRKIFSGEMQQIIDQQNVIYAERFPMTSSLFLDEWEYMLGLPMSPSGKTIQDRRNAVITRLRGGPFSRIMRRTIVEGYLIVLAFGDPILLLPPGVGFDGTGLPLFGEAGLVKDMYRIYEDRQRFAYKVKIDSDFTPDTVALTRDLKFFSYGGLTVNVDASKNSPLDFEWDTYDIEPDAFWMLIETAGTAAADSFVNGLNGTYTGSFTLNSSALLTNDGTRKAVKLTGGYITVPDNNALDLGDNLQFGAWIKRDVIDANDQYLISKGTGAYGIRIGGDGKIVLSKVGTGDVISSTVAITDGNIHHVVVQKSGSFAEIWIDGVNCSGAITNQTLTDNATALNIGREVSGANLNLKAWISYVTLRGGVNTTFFTSTEIQRRYNTGLDILFDPGLQ